MNQQLLRRAWDALDSFKQAYPENWQEDDEQVMVDLMRADIKMSGVQTKWVGLTPQERDEINEQVYGAVPHHVAFYHAIEQALKEKNQ